MFSHFCGILTFLCVCLQISCLDDMALFLTIWQLVFITLLDAMLQLAQTVNLMSKMLLHLKGMVENN